MKKFIQWVGVILIAVFFFGGMSFAMIKGNEKQRIEIATLSQCLLENEVKYKSFLLDCISALSVEENSYIVDSCDRRAVRLYCGDLNRI